MKNAKLTYWLLINTNAPIRQIVKLAKIDKGGVSKINTGKRNPIEGVKYPIRKKSGMTPITQEQLVEFEQYKVKI